MCGIVGGYTSAEAIQRGIEAAAHRGPDGNGLFVVGDVVLGHTRLAILDLDKRSDQPFLYGDTALVYNGECWNFRTLREEFVRKGYEFSTSGDTEVVAAIIDSEGCGGLHRIEGQFAMAWVGSDEHLYVACDRFGEVPVFYTQSKPFLFASERKILLAAGVQYQKVAQLEPGRVLKTDGCTISQASWYDLSRHKHKRFTEIEDAAPAFRELILQGVVERAVSDVPVCVLLSGGVDSTLVTWLAHQSGVFPDLCAYLAVYDENSPDVKTARRFASDISIRLVEVPVHLPPMAELEQVVFKLETHLKVQVEIGWALLLLAEKIASDGYKVVIGGDGADEILGSYFFTRRAIAGGEDDWSHRKQLLLSQYRKNFLRNNFSVYGLWGRGAPTVLISLTCRIHFQVALQYAM